MSNDKVDVELDLDDKLLFDLMKEAHKRDITLNQLVEKILVELIEKHKHEQIQRESTPTGI